MTELEQQLSTYKYRTWRQKCESPGPYVSIEILQVDNDVYWLSKAVHTLGSVMLKGQESRHPNASRLENCRFWGKLPVLSLFSDSCLKFLAFFDLLVHHCNLCLHQHTSSLFPCVLCCPWLGYLTITYTCFQIKSHCKLLHIDEFGAVI